MASTRIVVAGALAAKPGNGGEAWVRLSWVGGLLDLGFEVWFVEELADTATDPVDSTEAQWFRTVTSNAGFVATSVLVAGDRVAGLENIEDVADLVASADLVVNISGNLRSKTLLGAARRAAYVDLDPGFTQIWDSQGNDLGLDDHTLHFTVGANIGTAMCPLPTSGRRWLPVRQPVVLADWPMTPPSAPSRFTTVATWRCPFGPPSWDGVDYGLKLHEFRRIMDLPRHTSAELELAIAIDPADGVDRDRFVDAGWNVIEAADVCGTPEAFRSYVQASRGELTAAQGVYVHAATGWFSDRSARYLASGRPVVVQDTGLEAAGVPVGSGLVTFTDTRSAARALDTVLADYEHHADAARSLASEHFGSAPVLTDFIARCFA